MVSDMSFINSLSNTMLLITFSLIHGMNNEPVSMTTINDWQDAAQFEKSVVAYTFLASQAINYGYLERGDYFCLEKDYPKGYCLTPLLKKGEPLDTFVLKNEFIVEHKPALRRITQQEREDIKKKLNSRSHELAFIDKDDALNLLENK